MAFEGIVRSTSAHSVDSISTSSHGPCHMAHILDCNQCSKLTQIVPIDAK